MFIQQETMAQATTPRKRRYYCLNVKLEAVEFAENNSKEAAARKYGVDSKRIREWCQKKEELKVACKSTPQGNKRKKLDGAGRKCLSETLEEMLVEWISDRRSKRLYVSRKMVVVKAKELFEEEESIREEAKSDTFAGSNGWLYRFFQRHCITIRRKTTMAQKLPEQLAPKVINFILYVRLLRNLNKYLNFDMIAMDETAVWFDMPTDTTVDFKGVKSVPIKTTGHEKSRITVILAARASGQKIKPTLIFKGKKMDPELEKVKGVKVLMSPNGWMNQELTISWLHNSVGKMSFNKRLLVWDAYRCHISEATKATLKEMKVEMAVIPGGCTGLIQAPDVSWNAPFKGRVTELYWDWMANGEKTFTPAGNMRAPPKHLLAQWVRQAWDGISTDIIEKSFKVCGITNDLQDPKSVLEIRCMKEEGILSDFRDELVQKSQEQHDKENMSPNVGTQNAPAPIPTQEVTEDYEQLDENELCIVDEDA